MPPEQKEFVEAVVIDREQDQEQEQEQDREQDREQDQEQEQEQLDPRLEIGKRYDQKEYGEPEQQEPEPEQEPEQKSESEPKLETKPDKIEVVVNGKRMMADPEKIDKAGGVENYQRNLASHLGLQDLAKQRNMLEQERKMFDEYVLEQQQNLPTPDDPKPVENKQTLDNRNKVIKQYHDAVYEGDNDLADSLMGQLIDMQAAPQQVVQPTINEDEIVQKAASVVSQQQAEVMYRQQVGKAQEVFAHEFPEINNDPIAKSVANDKTRLLMSSYPDWTPEQVILEAGKQTRTWLNDVAGISEDTENTQAKIDAKSSMVNVNAGSTRSKQKAAPKPMTNSDYINQLRRSRGLD